MNYNSKMPPIFILYAALWITAITGCRKKEEITADCSAISATYSGDIKPIVNANCLKSGCHDAGSSRGDYTTYDGLKAKADNGTLFERIVEKQNMPKGGSLTTDQRAKFKCWIEAGAPQN